jgi:hypothetical protein
MNNGAAKTRYPDGSAAVDTEVDQAFCDLVYADADFVRAAFEAITAAEWGRPHRPARRPQPPTPPARPDPFRTSAALNPAVPDRHLGVAGWARARSPPPRRGPTRGLGPREPWMS